MCTRGKTAQGPDSWRKAFSENVEAEAGKEIAAMVIGNSSPGGCSCSGSDNSEWTKGAIERLERELPPEKCSSILTKCSHMLVDDTLLDLKHVYEKNRDIDELFAYWRRAFAEHLRNSEAMDKRHAEEIIGRGWGLPGAKIGNMVLVTKIPFDMDGYFEAKTETERKRAYCHCDRIRDSIDSGTKISATYCYCGGGFYKKNLEKILGRPVEVRMIRSLLKGDDVCEFSIQL